MLRRTPFSTFAIPKNIEIYAETKEFLSYWCAERLGIRYILSNMCIYVHTYLCVIGTKGRFWNQCLDEFCFFKTCKKNFTFWASIDLHKWKCKERQSVSLLDERLESKQYRPLRIWEASFNNWVCPRGWSLPLGVNVAHRDEICPLGVNVHPFFSPPVHRWTLGTVSKNGRENREFHPQGITSPLGVKSYPCGTTSPLGVKVCS
jgi:hypothetical protein